MGKSKLKKYERVKCLPNVTISEFEDSNPDTVYPWNQNRFEGMQRVLELGCGKGEHSIAFASADPQKLCVGVDFKSHRICAGAEKALSEKLENVLFLRTRIERICDFFTDSSINEIWLTFPDPHPGSKGIKSRLTSGRFLDLYSKILIKGGKVHLKTDSESLYNYTLESVNKWGGVVTGLSNNISGNFNGNVNIDYCGSKTESEPVSAFEKAALDRGLYIKYAEFTLS